MIDKRTMHEASIRVPLVVRYPRAIKPGTVIEEHVLSLDLAPSIIELTVDGTMKNIQGRSWAGLATGESSDWREAWLYEYNYEVQFPYTPNVRGIRKGDWKYVAYPHGDGGPLRHMEELYNMAADPGERRNLAQDPSSAEILAEMRIALAELLKDSGANPDSMPIDQGIKIELPEESIR
jgi:N-acetylglucosamine-6-sulfatase